MEPALIEKCLAFCRTLANSNNKVLFKLSAGMDAFQFNKELFKSFCPVKNKSASQMRREEARRNKYCLGKSNQVSVGKKLG